ncbi:DUF6252 family protein [Flavobacterium sp.]|uniref:DUF6252 family protein n=1 Tax=Flavobacterium sp. TaxID=239 RepID=UPI0035292938
MKSIKLLAIFILSVTMFACSNDDDGGNDGTAAAGTVTAKVDGTTVTSTSELTVATLISYGSSNVLSIQGTNMEGKGYRITINDVDGEGTFQLGGNSVNTNIASYVEGNATDPLNSQMWTAPYDDDSINRGEVAISSFSETNVKGTFSFSCKNPNDDSVKTITEGSFNVTITQ